MIEKINSEQIRQILGNAMQQKPDSASNTQNNDADVSLRVSYASFIDKATQPVQTDPQAVSEAKELLSSGRLESPENIRQAAENLLELGI